MKAKNQASELTIIGYPGKGVKLSSKIIDISNCVIVDPENEIQINMEINNTEDKRREHPIDSHKIRSLTYL